MAGKVRDPNAPKKSRAPATPKPAYFVIQVLDAQGTPVAVEKAHVRLVSVERSAEKVLDLVESGKHPHAVYIRGMLPVQRRTLSPTA